MSARVILWKSKKAVLFLVTMVLSAPTAANRWNFVNVTISFLSGSAAESEVCYETEN